MSTFCSGRSGSVSPQSTSRAETSTEAIRMHPARRHGASFITAAVLLDLTVSAGLPGPALSRTLDSSELLAALRARDAVLSRAQIVTTSTASKRIKVYYADDDAPPLRDDFFEHRHYLTWVDNVTHESMVLFDGCLFVNTETDPAILNGEYGTYFARQWSFGLCDGIHTSETGHAASRDPNFAEISNASGTVLEYDTRELA